MHSSTGHEHIPGCWAIARSGIPAREPLFNGTICRHPGRWGQLAYSRGFTFGNDGGVEHLEVHCATAVSNRVFCVRETCRSGSAQHRSKRISRTALHRCQGVCERSGNSSQDSPGSLTAECSK